MPYVSDEQLFPVWHEPRSRWEQTGLTAKQQRLLDLSMVALLALFTLGWLYTAVVTVQRGDAPSVARSLGSGSSPLSPDARPEATFAINAVMEQLISAEEFRGASGELQVVIQEPGDTLALPAALPEEVAVAYGQADGADTVAAAESGLESAPPRAGLWNLFLRMGDAVRSVPQLRVATLIPSTSMQSGYIGEYRIGNWPAGEGAYSAPRGFVEVTPENMDTPVSTHFQLKDFLTKGQEGVWPKYVVISTRLLDKLELTLQQLESEGHPIENVFVVSGFRTPWYNRAGGNTQGRGSLSRHMYGDAADIAIDNDGDGCMDDLTGDGRATVADARVIAGAAEAVEQRYPHLVGGIGIYAPTGAHCGMVHIDTRGNRARW